MKRKFIIFAAVVMQLCSIQALAVTDKEMEQARVIAAKAYLRYANDGSGYLDELKPKSMSDLESKIKPKEKENLKAFKAVGVPRDYASWDKAKLVEYWSVTFFKSPGLTEKGKMARARVRKNVSAMNVAPPKSEAEKKAEEQKKAEAEKKAAADKAKAEASKEAAALAAPVAGADTVATGDAAAMTDSIGKIQEKVASLDESSEDVPEEKSHTWVYLLVLAILVGVVIWLVSFAPNVMKRSGEGREPARRSEEERLAVRQAGEASKEMREKFAATLTQKNAEISQLNAKVDQLNRENASMKRDMQALVAETGSLRTRLTDAQNQLEEIRKAAVAAAPAPCHTAPQPEREDAPAPVAAVGPEYPAPQPRPQSQPAAQAAPQRRHRTIFLGRVNNKGIFVRADRELNVGNSIYVLETTDGYAGTFRVVADPVVWEMALLTPQQSLMGGCTGDDLDLHEGMTRIVTESPGTAVFEGGCWRVIRKARIRYE